VPDEYCQCGTEYATTYSVAAGIDPCPWNPTSTGQTVVFSTPPVITPESVTTTTSQACDEGWCGAPFCVLCVLQIDVESPSTCSLLTLPFPPIKVLEVLIDSEPCDVFHGRHVTWNFVYPSKHLNDIPYRLSISIRPRTFESTIYIVVIEINLCLRGAIVEFVLTTATAFQQL